MLVLGFSYHMGWSCCAVAEFSNGKLINVLRTGRIETGEADDRLSLEPYHVAGGWQGLERVPVPGEPDVLVQQGIVKQKKHTLKELKRFLGNYRQDVATGAVLTSRGRRADTVQQALNSHAQIHVAESHAVSDAIQEALGKLGLIFVAVDKKSLFEQTETDLQRDKATILAELKNHAPVEGPWRQEEKQCVIAAWLASLK